MRRHIIFGSLVLLLSCDYGALTFAQTTAASEVPQYSVGPLTDYSAAVPGPNDVLRLRRGQRYNAPDASLPALGEQSDDGLVGGDSGHSYLDSFPFSQSDTVVVGRSPQVRHICRTTSEISILNSKSPCRRHVQFHLHVIFNQPIASMFNVTAVQFACRRAKCSFVRSEIFPCLSLANDICYF